jgi:Domain of unknown function (DUF4398)
MRDAARRATKTQPMDGACRLRDVPIREDLMKILYTGFVVGIGLAALACGSAPQPTERLATAQGAVRAAKEIGAKDVPQAQLHTQLAEEQVQQAQKLIADGENERAEMVLRRATADAELAVALARESESQKQAQAAEASLGSQPSNPPSNMQATNQ